MVFLSFIYFTATAFPFLILAFPAQSVPTSVSPSNFAKPGTLLGRHYTLHDRTDAFNGVGEFGQPNSHSGPGDAPIPRAARFSYSQRKRRSMPEDDVHGEDFLSDVHPEFVPSSSQTSTAHQTHPMSTTLIPSPASTPGLVKTKLKGHKHMIPSAKKSKSASMGKE